MSDPLPDNFQGPHDPETEARRPITPSLQALQGKPPVWADPAEESALGESPAFGAGAERSLHGLTLERDGRNAMADTAERIGSAVGSAHRQVRRGLELVRRPAIQIGAASSAAAVEAAERATQIAHEGVDIASRAIEDIKVEISDSREQAARMLDEWSEQAGARFQEFQHQASRALFRSRQRVQELGDQYPLQTIATVAGVCFALGVALRLRRSHRG